MSAKKETESDEYESKKLLPSVAKYCPCTIKGLQEGDVKYWCACGLSKNQPWCDGSHIGTGIKPLKWTVPKTQTLYLVCGCKYTSKPPLCDGTHVDLPCKYKEQQEKCPSKESHVKNCKLCTGCGWVPDF